MPWTALAYVLTASGGLGGLDVMLIVVAVLVDPGSYGVSGYKYRRRF